MTQGYGLSLFFDAESLQWQPWRTRVAIPRSSYLMGEQLKTAKRPKFSCSMRITNCPCLKLIDIRFERFQWITLAQKLPFELVMRSSKGNQFLIFSWNQNSCPCASITIFSVLSSLQGQYFFDVSGPLDHACRSQCPLPPSTRDLVAAATDSIGLGPDFDYDFGWPRMMSFFFVVVAFPLKLTLPLLRKELEVLDLLRSFRLLCQHIKSIKSGTHSKHRSTSRLLPRLLAARDKANLNTFSLILPPVFGLLELWVERWSKSGMQG